VLSSAALLLLMEARLAASRKCCAFGPCEAVCVDATVFRSASDQSESKKKSKGCSVL
jgi:hypothetical protein